MAWGVGLLGLSLADVGWTPYVAFAHHLPRLLSGEAFPAMMLPEGMSLNQSVPGLPIKLLLFGLAPATLTWARVAGWLYTPVLLWATFRLARTSLAKGDKPFAWLAVLLLATYRSTFLPQYAVFPPLWLLVLLAGRFRERPRALGLLAAAWLLLTLTLTGRPDMIMASGVLTTLETVAGLIVGFAVLRLPGVEREGERVSAPAASSPLPA
jgi:alpha-1,2-mannosyltransferase